MKTIHWNMNYQVGIKWTDEAAKIYRDHYGYFPAEKNVDKDGFAWMPGWEMAFIFGKHLMLGKQPPFPMNMKIEVTSSK